MSSQELIDISELTTSTQNAALVYIGKTQFTEEEVEKVRSFLIHDSGTLNSRLLKAISRLPELSAMYAETRLSAIEYVRADCSDNDDWVTLKGKLQEWVDTFNAHMLASARESIGQEPATVESDPVPYDRFAKYGALRVLKKAERCQLQDVIGLTLAKQPLAGASDWSVRKARAFCKSDPVASAWYSLLVNIPTIMEFKPEELVLRLEPLFLNPALVNDANAMAIATEEALFDVEPDPFPTLIIKDGVTHSVEVSSQEEVAVVELEEIGSPEPVVENAPVIDSQAVKEVRPTPAAIEVESAPPAPERFEYGVYEGIPSEVYHAAQGVSSTQLKDARRSLMYFYGRHVARTIPKPESRDLDVGKLFHTLVIEPEKLEEEYSIEPEIPEDAFHNSDEAVEFLKGFNAELPPEVKTEGIKDELRAWNDALPKGFKTPKNRAETEITYAALPPAFQAEESDQQLTVDAMKDCIKAFNDSLTQPLTGFSAMSREDSLKLLETVNPERAREIRQQRSPLPVSGGYKVYIPAIREVLPNAIFATEVLEAWEANPENKILVKRTDYALAQEMVKAVNDHPHASKLLNHPARKVEVSYFEGDWESGLDVRVRPDVTIDVAGSRIGLDLKSIYLPHTKEPDIEARLFREIVARDYHVSAAMYSEVARLNQFFWVFVNKEPGYHWIAIVEASEETLALGAAEYHATLGAIAEAYESGEWPSPFPEKVVHQLSTGDRNRLKLLNSI